MIKYICRIQIMCTLVSVSLIAKNLELFKTLRFSFLKLQSSLEETCSFDAYDVYMTEGVFKTETNLNANNNTDWIDNTL